MKKPLVSLTVICYRAEKFIREAVEGALSQTYSPLEIIFSDDASPDATFSIIEEMVRDYKGPHKIVLNRNETNMGIGAHVSKVWFDIAKGDWIIVSAGDDVSIPHRVERLMEVATPEIGAIHHRVIPIDEESKLLPQFLTEGKGEIEYVKLNCEEIIKTGYWLKGATMCLNKQMLLKYGKLNNGLINEDNVLAYRASHFGGIIFVDELLMKYRIHPKSISNQNNINDLNHYIKRIVQGSNSVITINRQIFDDAKMINFSKSLLTFVKRQTMEASIDLWLFDNGNFDWRFLTDAKFYAKCLKKVFIKLHWKYFISKKEISVY